MSNSVDVMLAAALCEEIYRRAPGEQSLGESTTLLYHKEGFASFYDDPITPKEPTIVGLTNKESYYYNDDTGFVGRIVEANGKIFVVLRGSDLSAEFTDAIRAMFASDPAQADSKGGTVDTYDWYNNRQMGKGTLAPSQIDDALALLAAAKEIAGNQEIKVTGQSLGGGLAALVTAINNADTSQTKKVSGITVAQAPFETMYETYRGILTLKEIGITKEEIATWPPSIFFSGIIDPQTGMPVTPSEVIDRDFALRTGVGLEKIVREKHPEKFSPFGLRDGDIQVRFDRIKDSLYAAATNDVDSHRIFGEGLDLSAIDLIAGHIPGARDNLYKEEKGDASLLRVISLLENCTC
jgi:hypothetical protein